MTYIELINHFWQLFENKGMKPNDALLYFFLLKECNRKSWQNPFSLSNKSVVIALEISEKSVIDSRRRLIERELIKVKKGDRNCSAPEYFIIGVEEENFYLPTESRTVDEMSMNGRRTVTLYKDLKTKDNISSNEDSSTTPARESCQLPLFADEEKKTKRKSKAKDPPPPPPTYEEVRQYFLTHDADIRLENWEESCQRFYDNFTAVDWRDKFNRRITRWDSRANSWILDDEKRQKENKAHEVQNQPRASGPDNPRGGVSIRGRVTPGCGLKRRDPSGET